MKLKKKPFHPKKVTIREKHIERDEKQLEHMAEKHPRGHRFGHRFFPYNKSGS